MNAAYVMGTRLTDAFAKYRLLHRHPRRRGRRQGRGPAGPRLHRDDGDLDLKCPTEIGITDRREAELSKLGFLPLCHYKNTDYAVFFGGQTTQKPKKYDRPEATANAAISARLPYIMATCRFAHYLKVMARDKIGSFMEASDCETWLNRWIQNYVNSNADAGQEMKARFPLREAKVEVKEIPGKPGSYNAIAYLRPWLQMEELTTSCAWSRAFPRRPDRPNLFDLAPAAIIGGTGTPWARKQRLQPPRRRRRSSVGPCASRCWLAASSASGTATPPASWQPSSTATWASVKRWKRGSARP